MFCLGFLVANSAKAEEDQVLQEAQSMYVFEQVFDGAALMFRSGAGLELLDLDGAKVVIVQYPDCAQLIIDLPLAGPRFVGCVENTLDAETQED